MSVFEPNKTDITLRNIQHFAYCPHRWGLMELDCSFAENAFVYKGNLVHQRVDSTPGVTSRGVRQEHSVHVHHPDWGIYGIIDCLEFRRDEQGVWVDQLDDYFSLTIVEYKVTAPKQGGWHPADGLQLLAQKLCVDYLFGCDSQTVFYYANTKKRVDVVFTNDEIQTLKKTLIQMRDFQQKGIIPPIPDHQHCGGCSMKDICLPLKKVNSGA